jgi:penicillin-binding protein 1A
MVRRLQSCTPVAVAWIGFDTPKEMGAGEAGSLAALPIWMGYMGSVEGIPEGHSPHHGSIMAVPINPQSVA